MAIMDTEYLDGIIRSCQASRNRAALWAVGEFAAGTVIAIEGLPLPGALLMVCGAYLGKLALDEHGYAQDARDVIAT